MSRLRIEPKTKQILIGVRLEKGNFPTLRELS